MLSDTQLKVAEECATAERWSKLKIQFVEYIGIEVDTQIIEKVFEHFKENKDFALSNDKGCYIYFFNDFTCAIHDPKNVQLDCVFKIKDLESTLRIALASFNQFIPNNALQFNKVYKKLCK